MQFSLFIHCLFCTFSLLRTFAWKLDFVSQMVLKCSEETAKMATSFSADLLPCEYSYIFPNVLTKLCFCCLIVELWENDQDSELDKTSPKKVATKFWFQGQIFSGSFLCISVEGRPWEPGAAQIPLTEKWSITNLKDREQWCDIKTPT